MRRPPATIFVIEGQNFKDCGGCKRRKLTSDFSLKRKGSTLFQSYCRECLRSEKMRNPEREKSYFRRYNLTHKEKKRKYTVEWQRRNRDRHVATVTRWNRRNPAKVNARVAHREFRKQNATPVWANKEAILAVYIEAARRQQETGVPHHVDHIVPLICETVQGLHNEFNLQILTAEENRKKGNRYWPGMSLGETSG